MEDEDVDGQATDAGTVEEVEKSPRSEDTLKRTSEVLSEPVASPCATDGEVAIDDGRDDRNSSDASEDSPEKIVIDGSTSKIIFKGFKKRILAQTQENPVEANHENSQEIFRETSRGTKEKKCTEIKRGKITEYAQYLGLQPASTNNKTNNKCPRCSNPSTTNSCNESMTKPQQCTCSTITINERSSPGTSEVTPRSPSPRPSTPSSANNFRITRKVYLCAACGTYFENWNLFLHMRDVHKRHICLFCLGMFGQAERLSYHLTKKHSVPETTYTSVEDFYNVFKDSCYLICCTCEKVFTETDNFYNHYCSPLPKGRNTSSTSEVCSFCRQTVGHANTCNHGDTRENSANSSGIPGIPGVTPKKCKDAITGRNKRSSKNNRLKRSEESKLTSYQKKLSMMYARKMKMKSRETVSSGDEVTYAVGHNSIETATTTIPTATTTTTTTREISTTNEITELSRDTVTETIMEVSKCTDDDYTNDDNFDKMADATIVTNKKNELTKMELSPCHTVSGSPSRSPSPRRRHSDGSLYDSVAETIMEVSRCSNDTTDEENNDDEDDDDDDDDNENNDDETRKNDRTKKNIIKDTDAEVSTMKTVENPCNDEDSANVKSNYDDRLKPSTNEENKITTDRNEPVNREITESDDDRSTDRSIVDSPTRLNSSNVDTESGSSPIKQSKTTSVSFATVNTTDRSLVIKICTNRNSQFSVTSANGVSYNENHDTSRESEENNNDDDSGSEKRSNCSGIASPTSCRADDDDDDDEDEEEEENDEDEDDEDRSDSDAEKLSVVDVENRETEDNDVVVDVTNVDDKIDRQNDSDDPKIDVETVNENIDVDTVDEIAKNSISNDSETVERDDAIATNETNEKSFEQTDGIILAAEDVASIDLNVDGLLETMEIDDLLKRCINAASNCCVYCNHARHIAVNGKQLSLHVLAEHRFQPQHPAIIIQREQFISRVKKSMIEVEKCFFNLESFDTQRGTYDVKTPRVFECFHCRYHSHVHKDIYLHNRKMHQKTILICIMCKSTFYSYSELLCHLCPGVYSPNVNVTYRCCLCTVSDLPSAFRLMVHLRKRHHSCDVCLESTGNQQRLSNHVWKHKLHHLCYRCGIAYRNKPDITKHLFWKHGTESVLCKKCLQKKWPHVYHFCIPPTAFVCEECNGNFSRAVALKVHKRLHTGDRPYGCGECEERFISKKLLARHEIAHREPVKTLDVVDGRKTPERRIEEAGESIAATVTTMTTTTATTTTTTMTPTTTTTSLPNKPMEIVTTEVTRNAIKSTKEIVKKVVDVYDLPPLNLSSDSDSDIETPPKIDTLPKSSNEDDKKIVETTMIDEENKCDNSTIKECVDSTVDTRDAVVDPEINEEVKKEEAQIMDGIWHNFKSYAASLENRGSTETTIEEKMSDERLKFLCEIILADHDYCVISGEKTNVEDAKTDDKMDDNCGTMGGEHDYGYKQTKSPSSPSVAANGDSDAATASPTKRKKDKSPKKKKQNGGSASSSDSSSDSDSSSCSCGTNCSCSSSSSGSSSSTSTSSDSESSGSENSPKKSVNKKERRKEKEKDTTTTETTIVAPTANEATNEITEVEKIVTEVSTNVEDTTFDRRIDDDNQNVEIEEKPIIPKVILRESDLDTEETETDEDFYDEHPQQLANKLLAEKRNQLMLLAAVAPVSVDKNFSNVNSSSVVVNNLNNGAIDVKTATNFTINETAQSTTATTTATVENDKISTNARGQIRKRVKTKKRKKTEKNSKTNRIADQPTVESIKLNIPKSFYQKKKSGYGSSTGGAMITVLPSRSSTPSLQNSTSDGAAFATDKKSNSLRITVAGSGSENEKKRSSKRKRVPKRFYGDSSDEEAERQQQIQLQQQQQLQSQQSHHVQTNTKWRKIENSESSTNASAKTQTSPPPTTTMITTTTSTTTTTVANNPTKNVTLRLSGFDRSMERIVPMNVAVSATESDEPGETSSAESTDTEEVVNRVPEPERKPIRPVPSSVTVASHPPLTIPHPGVGPERSVNLYCYCQCPYDEVSEMIACDGDDCRIEWFHFECVGIMVPPKGKWYCPDCRKKDESLPGNEDGLE